MLIGANVVIEAVRDLWGPGLVFLALCAWLVRRAVRAARNESILEEQRLRAAFGDLVPAESSGTETDSPAKRASTEVQVPQRLAGADVRGASQEHLETVARALAEREGAGPRASEVLWVRSSGAHVAWGERRGGDRETICVAQVDSGKIVARWQFG
ncbi:MAG TPA: hypothetical protein VE620_01115 [Myxococcales bacterium]|jgi:hypothetical protein|nr:hypothetical protein [Myxococcales bacterium]